jgi:hypothetical protein
MRACPTTAVATAEGWTAPASSWAAWPPTTKRFERELVPQYQKLRKKATAGAQFVINRVGWNARKDDELLRYIRRAQRPLFAIGNVYLLSRGAARAFHAGRIPGVVVTDELLELVERYAAGADKGRAYFVDLAAKHAEQAGATHPPDAKRDVSGPAQSRSRPAQGEWAQRRRGSSSCVRSRP